MSRTLYSLKNVFTVWASQLIILGCSFIVRIVFARYLSQEYLGLQTLFSSVLSILSLVELGVGSAIVFELYKPLAEDDREAVKSIMRLFRRAYITIGSAIFALGLILAPNIRLIIDGAPDIPNLELYFLLFVLNTAVSYFFAYKGSLITADQRNYIVVSIDCLFQVLQCVAQLLILMLTGNYVYFLACMILATLFRNFLIVITSNRLYPYLREKDIAPIKSSTATQIKKNVSALLIHKISSMVKYPLNTVMISLYLGLNTLAIYGNYFLIINSAVSLIDKAFTSVVASLGNLGFTESGERQYQIFQVALFVNAMLTGFASICFITMLNPLIAILFGESYLFSTSVMVLFILWFYTQSIRSALVAYESAYGIFWELKWKSVAEMIFLLISVPLATAAFGVEGLLLTNIICQILISTIIEGYITFKYGLRRPSLDFFKQLVVYFALTFCLCLIGGGIMHFLPAGNLLHITTGILLSLGLISALAFIYRHSYAFMEAKRLLKSVLPTSDSRRPS